MRKQVTAIDTRAPKNKDIALKDRKVLQSKIDRLQVMIDDYEKVWAACKPTNSKEMSVRMVYDKLINLLLAQKELRVRELAGGHDPASLKSLKEDIIRSERDWMSMLNFLAEVDDSAEPEYEYLPKDEPEEG